MGTSELENGVAPGEYGTFGLFWPLESGEPWKDVMKEPAKNRLVPDAFIAIELTWSWAPVRPVNGGDDDGMRRRREVATQPEFAFLRVTKNNIDGTIGTIIRIQRRERVVGRIVRRDAGKLEVTN